MSFRRSLVRSRVDQTEEIDNIMNNPPEMQSTVDFLLSQWPDDEDSCPTNERYGLASENCRQMSTYERRDLVTRQPAYTTDSVQQPKGERYGRPLNSDHKANREFLYFNKLFISYEALT